MANHAPLLLGLHHVRRVAWGGFFVMLAACGSNVSVENSSGTGASGGPGGAGASGTTSTGSATTSSGTTGAGGATVSCESLGQAACIAAHPSCVPIYDDQCCSSCNPGPCADCVDYQFHHCAPYAEGCAPDTPFCGISLPEHCTGKLPACGEATGSPSPCGQWPGCTFADCPTNVVCDLGQQCIPVTGEACTFTCKALPPPCPPGMVAEANGFCWTGLCIMADVCAMP